MKIPFSFFERKILTISINKDLCTPSASSYIRDMRIELKTSDYYPFCADDGKILKSVKFFMVSSQQQNQGLEYLSPICSQISLHSEIFDKAEVKAKSMCEVANNFQLPKYNTCRYHSNIFFWFVYMMQHFRVWMLKSCV